MSIDFSFFLTFVRIPIPNLPVNKIYSVFGKSTPQRVLTSPKEAATPTELPEERNSGAIGGGKAGAPRPEIFTVRPNTSRALNCGSRDAAAGVFTTEQQQSATASKGSQWVEVCSLRRRATSAAQAFGPDQSSRSATGKPTTSQNDCQNFSSN
nr:hypothetical protein [Sneathiella sp. P13V-1]